MEIDNKTLNELIKNADKSKLYKTPPKGLTKEQMFYWKIKHDFVWYAENFLKIRDKNSKLVPFRLNEAQIIMETIDQYCKEHGIMRRYIILKARQMGMSTYTEGKLFKETSNNEFINSIIIAHQDTATQNLFNMSKLYYDELPPVIKPMKKYSNDKTLTFENPTNVDEEKLDNPGLRSKYSVHTANTVEAGRSATYHNVHASECAFFPNAKTTMLGLLQCVPDTMDTMVVIESTANGVGDYFYDIWKRATKGENNFIPIFLPWFTDSTYSQEFRSQTEKDVFIEEVNQTSKSYDGTTLHTEEYNLMTTFNLTYEQLKWRRWAIANKCGGDEEGFRQEYPSTPDEAFIATGRPRFSIKAIREYEKAIKEPKLRGYLREKNGVVTFEEDPKGYVGIWKEPKKDECYSIGADVAEGLIDGDYSVAYVGDYNFDVVARWYGHIDPDLYGKELVKLAKYYNDAYIGVESNNHGLTTLKAIQREEYWNIYYQKSYDKITDKITQKMGWSTTARTKPMMIDKLAEFIRDKYLGLYCDILSSELKTYIIEDNGSTNGQTGCNDDTVMALAILLQILLEGRGDNFTPEVPFDELERKRKFGEDDDYIDPLFEKNETIEYAR